MYFYFDSILFISSFFNWFNFVSFSWKDVESHDLVILIISFHDILCVQNNRSKLFIFVRFVLKIMEPVFDLFFTTQYLTGIISPSFFLG